MTPSVNPTDDLATANASSVKPWQRAWLGAKCKSQADLPTPLCSPSPVDDDEVFFMPNRRTLVRVHSTEQFRLAEIFSGDPRPTNKRHDLAIHIEEPFDTEYSKFDSEHRSCNGCTLS
eukprot:CAMPEP_0113952968 /NCGR_PEP_ID=MMETSP1339-20121228/90699_1 /TAXON_ID=94617 /ORGANISM="Fibrocapsa japonica" /LENGTH=117 /DNA_ID=CAMNT_0000961651 /DNA_START=797 /DNA_END=1150 /DNA_ORIENTATION=- /assembly_acc=CAM_ASM_000762